METKLLQTIKQNGEKMEDTTEIAAQTNGDFTLAAVRQGLRLTIPLAISIFSYGLVFGVLARQAGLSLLEAALMSGLVFAGSAQFSVLGLWVAPLPTLTIIFTTLVINLRHLLMGAALRPWFARVPVVPRYLTLFLLNDESWALTMSELNKGRTNAAFLLGSGLMSFAAWMSATLVGGLLGNILQNPEKWGLDFAFTAVFLGLLVGLWRGKSSLLPWIVAAVVAVAAAAWLPGKWYILLGGLIGSLVGAWQNDTK
jgi:4-azaleucine resistance transporter AzlC